MGRPKGMTAETVSHRLRFSDDELRHLRAAMDAHQHRTDKAMGPGDKREETFRMFRRIRMKLSRPLEARYVG